MLIGYAMRRISSRRIWPDDFQSLPQWRAVVRAHLSWIGSAFDGVASSRWRMRTIQLDTVTSIEVPSGR